jgi:diguanylate cyclase (GGDEF)-like protein
MLEARNHHLIIKRATITLALLVAALIAHTLWNAYQEYRTAKQTIVATEVVDSIIIAANVQAQERGIISALLGMGQRPSAASQAKIQTLRQAGDIAWQRAYTLLRTLPMHGSNMESMGSKAGRDYLALQEMRQQIDLAFQKGLGGTNEKTWFDTITRFINSAARLRDTVQTSLAVSTNMAQSNFVQQQWVWLASEHAGRERAILAYYIGAGKPLPADKLTTLQAYRGVMERNIADILALKTMPDTNLQVVHIIGKMEENFLGIYDTLRQQVYAGSGSGHYEIDTMHWFNAATAAIDSILNVGTTLSQLTRQDAQRLLQHSRNDFVLSLILLLVTFSLVVYSLNRVNKATGILAYHKRLAEMTLNALGDAVMTTDMHGNVTYLNAIAEGLIGWPNKAAYGQSVSKIFNVSHYATGEAISNPVEVCLQKQRIILSDVDVMLTDKRGKEQTIEYSAAPIVGPYERIIGVVLAFFKVGEGWGGAPQMLSYYATHDPLTSLINRREFDRRLADALHQVKRAQVKCHALCYLDLDQFKVVNDTSGHIAGDKLLCQLAYLLQEQLGDRGIMARLGGDEFGIILANCSLSEARKVAEELLQATKDFRFVWEGKPFTVSASIGLVPITPHSINPASLLSEADTACIAAKEKGRNRIQIYEIGNEELEKRHSEMNWGSRINEALKEDRFQIYAQLIRPLQPSLNPHCEILVRMLNGQGELVPPMSFLPAAEQYGLMPDIDRWVIHNSLKLLHKHMQHRGEQPPMMCNINISANSLGSETFQQFVFDQLTEFAFPPQFVCFEITETAAVVNFEQAIGFIKAMKKMGCKFALDDFGTGMSSLSYLKKLPVDFLKIDGSLIRHIDNDPVMQSMVEAICKIGHAMGLRTIAEFVENDVILNMLKEMGVDYAQGFGIAKPQPLEECLESFGNTL